MYAHGMAETKFVYLPNGIDASEWQTNKEELPEEHREKLDRLRQTGHFIIGYTGALGLANSLDSVIDAAALLKTRRISFVLIGQGPEKKCLQREALQRGLANVIFLPPVPKNSIPALLREMDALYIGLKKHPLFRFGVSPNKLMDYMMAAKPVIYAIEGDNDLVKESGCGISVPAEDPAAIADAVVQLMHMTSNERMELGLKGRNYVLAHHDYRILAQKFLDALQ